ncbi:31727_t:CDS:2, partial [Racocetra persica]
TNFSENLLLNQETDLSDNISNQENECEELPENEGFSYKIRRSESENGIIRWLTYKYSKSGNYNAQTTVDLMKQYHTSSQRTGLIAPQFCKFIPEMLADIKKYVIIAQMDSSSIFSLLSYNYPKHTINKRDLYNAVYRFHRENNPSDSDAAQILQSLLQFKENDPR